MSVVLDTSVLVDLLRGLPAAIRYAEHLDEPPMCSEVTRVEILQGMRSAERRSIEEIFASIRWVDVDELIARRAGEFGRTWRRSHPGLGTPDLIIAATVAEMGASLATANTKHFPMFKGLRAPYKRS